jgi:PAS domain S-box-containing protein
MNNFLPLQNLTLHRKRSPGVAEIRTILDLLPNGAFLIDLRQWQVILSNSNITELTAYTRNELRDINPDLILSVGDGTETLREIILKPGETKQICLLNLNRRSGGSIAVQATVYDLDSARSWVLVVIEPLKLLEQRQAEQLRLDQFWDKMLELVIAPQQGSLEEALDIIIKAGYALTGATYLAIYQVDGENPILRRTCLQGSQDSLPEQISLADFIQLQIPMIWEPGKRVLTNLQRMARVGGISYLATTPIGQPNAWIGLLVIASESTSPPEYLWNTLGILASSSTSVIEGYTKVANLRQALDNQRQNLAINSAIAEAALDGVIVLDKNLVIYSLNPSAESALGYTATEVRGKAIENILISPDNLDKTFIDIQNNPVIHNLGSIKLYHRSGQTFLANVRILPVFIRSELQGTIVLFQDLSEQEEIRERNQQLEQRALLGEVTASFAHEVRNPINNISTGLQLLAINLPTDDPNQDNIHRLQHDCDRLAELVKSSLSFIRPMEYKLELVNLEMLLQNLLERWQPRLTRANIQVHLQVERDIPNIEGDLRALEQVFTNLIYNALQAMENTGGVLTCKIRIAPASPLRDRLEVSLTDTGPGIPTEIRDRIFEPFFTTKQNGTGLGLAIVKRIVTAHKGAINVTSIPGGTIFQVDIPIAKQEN